MSLDADGPLLTGGPAELVANARVAYLGTVGPDGAPHVVPVCPVLDLDRILVASEVATVKVRNIEANPAVTLCVDAYDEDWTKLRAVLVFGEATLIGDGFEWERDRNLFYEKFPQYPEQAPIEDGTTVMSFAW
jgi:nitroimidazol reductase NimA-like FMN-containing flavoprotein (pyridoxamine 5'-phosphate oxidase superfamily)